MATLEWTEYPKEEEARLPVLRAHVQTPPLFYHLSSLLSFISASSFPTRHFTLLFCFPTSLSLSLSRHSSVFRSTMARMILILAICVLPALASAARPAANPFLVKGRVYCDTCRAGYETTASTAISGAKVRVECKDRDTQKILYSADGTTDSTGTYKITVKEDHEEQLCDAMLVSSPQSHCSRADPGRDRARVILTRNNGMASDNRFANAMGFLRYQPLSGCQQLLKQYEESED